jgi:hypothetical protein
MRLSLVSQLHLLALCRVAVQNLPRLESKTPVEEETQLLTSKISSQHFP